MAVGSTAAYLPSKVKTQFSPLLPIPITNKQSGWKAFFPPLPMLTVVRNICHMPICNPSPIQRCKNGESSEFKNRLKNFQEKALHSGIVSFCTCVVSVTCPFPVLTPNLICHIHRVAADNPSQTYHCKDHRQHYCRCFLHEFGLIVIVSNRQIFTRTLFPIQRCEDHALPESVFFYFYLAVFTCVLHNHFATVRKRPLPESSREPCTIRISMPSSSLCLQNDKMVRIPSEPQGNNAAIHEDMIAYEGIQTTRQQGCNAWGYDCFRRHPNHKATMLKGTDIM